MAEMLCKLQIICQEFIEAVKFKFNLKTFLLVIGVASENWITSSCTCKKPNTDKQIYFPQGIYFHNIC